MKTSPAVGGGRSLHKNLNYETNRFNRELTMENVEFRCAAYVCDRKRSPSSTSCFGGDLKCRFTAWLVSRRSQAVTLAGGFLIAA